MASILKGCLRLSAPLHLLSSLSQEALSSVLAHLGIAEAQVRGAAVAQQHSTLLRRRSSSVSQSGCVVPHRRAIVVRSKSRIAAGALVRAQTTRRRHGSGALASGGVVWL